MSSKDDARSLEAVRQVLVGPERRQLRALADRLDDPDRRLADVRAALDRLVETEPDGLSRLLVPVVLPMLRGALVTQLRAYLRTFETLVEQTLTLRALRWRLQSWRTGVPLAVIALRETRMTRVEQLLLLDSRSGLALAAAGASPSGADVDVVSGMLTAVSAFVRDAFAEGRHAAADLERIEFGEQELLLGRGRRTTLVAAVRGLQTPTLRDRLLSAVRRIEAEHAEPIRRGADTDEDRERLEGALAEALYVEPAPTGRWVRAVLVGVGVIALLIALAGWQRHRARATEAERWVESLQARPGTVVTRARWQGGVLRVDGLRDPLAERPSAPRPASVEVDLSPFVSVEPEVVLRRAGATLKPPPSVQMRLSDGRLVLEGSAEGAWIAAALTRTPGLVGVRAVDTSGLADRRVEALRRAVESLAQRSLRFDIGRTRPADPDATAALAAELDAIAELAERTGYEVRLIAVGGADPTGGESTNRRLAYARARFLQALIEGRGHPSLKVEVADPEQGRPEERTAALRVRELRPRAPAGGGR